MTRTTSRSPVCALLLLTSLCNAIPAGTDAPRGSGQPSVTHPGEAPADIAEETLQVRVTWGHQAPRQIPFYIALSGSELALSHARPVDLESGDQLQELVCRGNAGNGDVDGLEFTISCPKRFVREFDKIVGHWTYLISQSDPDTVRRWHHDAGYRPDNRKLTVRLNETGTHGFSLTVDQLLNQRAFWFPELDLFVAAGESPISFAQHQQALERWRGLRILEQVAAAPEATCADFTARWEDMGSPAYHNPFEVKPGHIVCLAWDSSLHKFGIDRGGGVVNDYGKADQFRFQFDFSRLDKTLEGSWKGQHLFDGLPVITTVLEKDLTRYELEQFAYPLHGPPSERRGDIPMVLMQKLKITDLGGSPRSLDLGLTHEHFVGAESDRSKDDIQLQQGDERFTWLDLSNQQLLLAIEGRGFTVAATRATGQKTITNRIELKMDLPANGSRELSVKLPSPLVDPQDQPAFAALDYARCRERTVRFWEDYLARGASFEVPEKTVNDLFRANLWHSLRLPRRHPSGPDGVKMDLPYSNFAYSQTGTPWPVNQGVLVDYMVYDLRGYHAISREELTAIFRNNQEPNGRVGGFADWGVYSPGMLYSIAQNYLLSGDRAAFETLLPQTLKCLDYCLAQLQRSTQTTGACSGLVLLPLNDLTSAANAWAFNQAYYSAGLETLARALADIGHPRATECRLAHSRLKQNLQNAFGAAMTLSPAVQLRDHTWLPYVPCDASTPRRLLDAWYPTDVDTGALHMPRLRALDPNGFLTSSLLHDHEDNLFLHGWGMANEPVYNQQGMTYLWRDEPKAAIRAFYSGMACAFSHSALEPVEHRWHHPQYFGPPSTDGTWFELYRNMLIQEGDEDTLLLLQATPRAWLEDGKQISIQRAPTCYGPLAMEVVSHANRGEIRAEVQVPSRKSPAVLLIRFRHPQAKPIKSVLVNSQPWTDFDPRREWVRIPNPQRTRYSIVAHY